MVAIAKEILTPIACHIRLQNTPIGGKFMPTIIASSDTDIIACFWKKCLGGFGYMNLKNIFITMAMMIRLIKKANMANIKVTK